MIKPDDAPSHELDRLEALRRYAVLDTMPEAAYDRVVRLAAGIFRVPIAVVSFIDADRQWFKAKIGLDVTETPRVVAFCNTTIQGRELCLIPDTTRDPRFAENPFVLDEPGIRFYAGAPLLTPDGYALGTLCIVDTEARAEFSPAERTALADLAAIVMDELELRRELAERQREARRSALRARLLEGADSPGFTPAIDTAMSAVREAADALVCLLFRVAPDGRRLQVVGGEGRDGVVDEAYLAVLRAIGMTMENSVSGQAIATGKQVILERFDPELLDRYPGLALNSGIGGRSQIITPVFAGHAKYAMAVGFGAEPYDLDATKDLLADAASAMRPLLRRLADLEETELFRRAVEASSDAVIISDADETQTEGPTVRYVNAAFETQTGHSRDEAVGQRIGVLGGTAQAPRSDTEIRAQLAKGPSARQDVLSRRRDGSTFWADLSVSALRDGLGWPTHWVAIQRDITSRKLEALALAESEASFRYFFEQHPAPMWVYDKRTFAFLEVNQAMIAAYGWSREELLGMTAMDIRPEEDREAAAAASERITSGFSDTGPWRHRTASGEIRLVQIRSQVIEFQGRKAALVAVWDLTERIEAENAARELAAELRATFESISDGFYTLSWDWRFTYVNAQAERLLRRTAPELIGQNVWETFPDVLGTEIDLRFRRVARTRETERFEFRYPSFEAWFTVSVYPARDGVTVYFRDITEQRHREERLRLLETAVAKLNDIIMITEAEPTVLPGPRIVFVNPAFERRTGYTPEEVMGNTPRILQGPGTSRAELDRIAGALEKWEPVRSELLNYTKDGQEFWLEMDIVPVADDTGWYTHWVAVERDVTERRRAQTLLEQQAAMLAQARDAILVRDLNHRIEYWNRSAERIYGWTAEEALGQSVLDLLYRDSPAFAPAMEILLEEGYWEGQLEHCRKGGIRIIVEANWTLLRHEDGTPRAVLAVNSDISQRVALEGRLRQAQRMEAVGQLTGGIAHDFNNLLTVILGNAEMLMDSLGDDAELHAMAKVAVAAAERGAALTNRLLAFSRRQALDPRTVDVNQLLAGLVQMLRRTIGEQVDIAVMAAPGLWNALIDPPQLETAVTNLCINARQAMPAGGKLIIETENVRLGSDYAASEREVTPGDYIMIAVSDTGTGMTPEVAAQAFEPFFTTKDVGEGSGLGLSMVYGFVKQSGGHVKIYSEIGHGTSVKMYIPRAAAGSVKAVAPPEREHLPGGSENLLLVEDDPMVRAHAVRQLGELGYRVTCASSAIEALEALRSAEDFDLLFTDVVMPGGMNGRDLATEARQLRPGLRTLFTSGYTENSIVHHGRLDPGVMLLQKPYRRRELAEKIRLALDTPAG